MSTGNFRIGDRVLAHDGMVVRAGYVERDDDAEYVLVIFGGTHRRWCCRGTVERTYTRDDLVRAILGQQWAVACSQLKPMAMIDLKKRRRYTSWGIWRPSAASRAIASLPSPDDVVTAMEQV